MTFRELPIGARFRGPQTPDCIIYVKISSDALRVFEGSGKTILISASFQDTPVALPSPAQVESYQALNARMRLADGASGVAG